MRPFFREVKHYPSSNPQVSARHLAAVLQLRVIEDMRQLSAGLAQIDGITVYPTGANFVCFRIDTGITARDLQRRLLVEHGMYVRDCSNKVGMDRFHIRIRQLRSPSAGRKDRMNYKTFLVSRYGGPEELQLVERHLRAPAQDEARIRVLAATVSRPDVSVRRGEALYSGTFLGQKLPFTPGYAIIGEVEAVGERVHHVAVGARVGVLTVVGGYTEVLYRRADRLIPVPATLDPSEAAPIILNYIVAYQTMHRVAKARAGETALIIGASGGIGTALLQLGALAGLKFYAIASVSQDLRLRAASR
ncbi:MAG: hypothetical protein BroJett021_14580 [Chloroflexota bacterium]|nr:alcohol dehydrogenase catalytic domain-containing protein [Caldilinea sp.]GIK72470.1 MAG: hypothetical protein BroJett021_14580 [Chloroflexota bacterium]